MSASPRRKVATKFGSSGGLLQRSAAAAKEIKSLIDAGVEKVDVGALDQTTQQNTALVQQSAAAAQSLSQQAARLTQIVSVFQL